MDLTQIVMNLSPGAAYLSVVISHYPGVVDVVFLFVYLSYQDVTVGTVYLASLFPRTVGYG